MRSITRCPINLTTSIIGSHNPLRTLSVSVIKDKASKAEKANVPHLQLQEPNFNL